MSTLRHQSPPFQRRADKAGTRPPGQGGGSSHALPAS